MKPIFARTPSVEERPTLVAGLKATDGWQVRRCQIILMSADEQLKAKAIASRVGLSAQQVRRVLHAFNQAGLTCLTRQKSGRCDDQRAFDDQARVRLREIVHQSPRTFGQETSLWTLRRLAQVSHQEGLTQQEVHFDTISQTLAEMNLSWKRVKHWINSPDEHYARKKNDATG
ncbi:MAG: helix-turn-helix domain-containing protein [Proteobacteria bacterium]|nr:helix-turn-helix domain-containing protein [Pseudomonadota bacterium]